MARKLPIYDEIGKVAHVLASRYTTHRSRVRARLLSVFRLFQCLLTVCFAVCIALTVIAGPQSQSPNAPKNSTPDASSNAPHNLPMCYYMPMPPQTKEAKKAKFHGVVRAEGVVNVDGHISNLRVVNPPGLGMDDVIVKTMKTWKCNPGVGPQGKPVPMLVPFELNFRLD